MIYVEICACAISSKLRSITTNAVIFHLLATIAKLYHYVVNGNLKLLEVHGNITIFR